MCEEFPPPEVFPIPPPHNINWYEPIACSFYINACFPCAPSNNVGNDGTIVEETRQLPLSKFSEAVNGLKLEGRHFLQATPGGIVIAFSKRDDAEKVFNEIDMAKVLEGPVQVALLPMAIPKAQNTSIAHNGSQMLVIRDVPWSVPVEELRAALHMQGIATGEMERWRQHVRVEIKNSMQCDRLMNEGVEFFGVARFPVAVDRGGGGEHGNGSGGGSGSGGGGPGGGNMQSSSDSDVLQCYRCQGFWHVAANCRHLPRCVRCGEPHGVEFCLRLRSNPLCCNCSGPHHAAYRLCPVRRQMSQAAPISFTLSKSRPAERLGAISPSTTATQPLKSTCIL